MLLLFGSILFLINNLVYGFSFGTTSCYSSKAFSNSNLSSTSFRSLHSKQLKPAAGRFFLNNDASFLLLQMSELTSAKPIRDRDVVVIISPSRGIGEVTATTLAREGCAVRWFVVNDNSNNKFYLPKETWDAINEKSGELDIAGGDASSILLPESNPSSIVENVRQWCDSNTILGGGSKINAIISCIDAGDSDTKDDEKEEDDDDYKGIQNAVKCVTRMACSKLSPSVRRIEISPVPVLAEESQRQQTGPSSTVADWISKTPLNNVFGGDNNIPTLREALMTSSTTSDQEVNLLTIRHGNLFGSPESDVSFSLFVSRITPFNLTTKGLVSKTFHFSISLRGTTI